MHKGFVTQIIQIEDRIYLEILNENNYRRIWRWMPGIETRGLKIRDYIFWDHLTSQTFVRKEDKAQKLGPTFPAPHHPLKKEK